MTFVCLLDDNSDSIAEGRMNRSYGVNRIQSFCNPLFFLTRVSFFLVVQLRCEQILRSKPESRLASEVHLASIESQEQHEAKQIKDAAIGGAVAMAAVGVAAGLATLLFSKH
jgi:hypothetical protein